MPRGTYNQFHIKLFQNFFYFLYFSQLFEFFPQNSEEEENNQVFSRFHSKILLNNCQQIMIFPSTCDIFCAVEKIQKPPKSALSCLRKQQKFSPLKFGFQPFGFSLNNSVACIQMAPNASEMIEYHPFWVKTDFGYFKT